MTIVVETESGTRYEFSKDGGWLVARTRQQGTTPDWRGEKVESHVSSWPPRVGRGMHFRLACAPAFLVSTSAVLSVEEA